MHYGVATISRLHKITGLLCRISSLLQALLQKRPIILRGLLIIATPYRLVRANYGVAASSRRLKIIGLFCKRDL